MLGHVSHKLNRWHTHILDGNNFEPPISENHNRMQIITSFAYFMHIIKFLVSNIINQIHIWQYIWIRLEILGKNDIIFLMVWPSFLELWVFEY